MASSSPTDDNRFTRFTDEDHSAPIWIASILALVFAYLILGIRLLFVKWNVYGPDDVVLGLAHIVGVGMWASLFSSLNSGLGQALKLLNAMQISNMNRAYFASRILLFLALGLSKCSVLVFIQAIFSHIETVQRFVSITAGIVVAWGIAGALAVSIGTSPDLIVGDQATGHRDNDILRLKIITILDVVSEVVILMLPVLPLLKIQMPWQRKLLVIVAFSFRIPNIVASIMHLIRYSDFINEGYRGTSIDSVIVWQNVLLSYSFMSATIPALKGFMTNFITGGMGYTGDISGSGSNSNNNYSMISLTSKGKVKQRSGPLEQGYTDSTAFVTSVPSSHKELSSSRTTRRATSEKVISGDKSITSQNSEKGILPKN